MNCMYTSLLNLNKPCSLNKILNIFKAANSVDLHQIVGKQTKPSDYFYK